MDVKIQHKLATLHNSYHRNLPHRLSQIEGLWLEAYQNTNARSLSDLYRAIHSLCGSAGLYGYIEICEIALRLDRYLRDLLTKPKLDAENLVTINELINALKACIIDL